MLLPFQLNGLNLDSGTAVAVVGGSTSLTEAQIVAGGEVITITLTNDTWVASGATFNAQRQNIIDGITSAQSEATGWNNEVRDNEVVTAVVRTSDTVVTITLTAAASYDVTADETITVTVPATALTAAGELVAGGTIDVTADAAPSTVKGGGKKRKRYIVEVDGQFFDAENISAVQHALSNARDLAGESAIRDVKTPVAVKPPRVSVKTASGQKTTSRVIQREVRQTQSAINKSYRLAAERIAKADEQHELLQRKLTEEDEEDALIALLM